MNRKFSFKKKIITYFKSINYTKLWLSIKLTFYIPKCELKLNCEEEFEIKKHKQRQKPFSFEEKSSYMISKEWQTMHKVWLHDKSYRCQMFPFLFLGQHKPKGGWYNNAINGKYAVHHVNNKAYRNLGMEVLDKDVIVLSKFAHKWIYHYLLSFGKKRAGEQKIVKFANPLQLAMNYWCFLNKWIKLIIIVIIIYGV